MNETIETLFEDFLEEHPAGELAAELHSLSAAIDEQIASGAVKQETIADYELAAMRMGYYAGFAAALELCKAQHGKKQSRKAA